MLQVVRALSEYWSFVEIMSPAGDITVRAGEDPASAVPSWPRFTANPYRIRHKYSGLRRGFANRRLAAKGRKYAAVIGVDPEGIGRAHRLNQYLESKLIYASFELLFRDEIQDSDEQHLKAEELEASSFVDLVLVQDELREKLLRENNQFRNAGFCLCPVAPMPARPERSHLLRNALAIPPEKRIVLLAGSVEPFTSRDLLHEMVSYWPDRYHLVVNCRAYTTKRERCFLEDLASSTGRVSLTAEAVPMDRLTDIFSSADFVLLPYKPVPGSWMSYKNVYHVGLSSGKASYAAMCGIPMIASALPTYEEIFARFNCGRTYNQVSQIPHILQSLETNYNLHSIEARRCYDEVMDPTKGIHNFCLQVQHLAARH